MLVCCSQKFDIYLPKKICLIIIHRNSTSLLDMSSCHQKQQQRRNNENTRVFMFREYMYDDILFSVTKAIPIMFERITTHYQTLKTWIGHNATHYHNLNALPHTLPNISSQFSMVWGYR